MLKKYLKEDETSREFDDEIIREGVIFKKCNSLLVM